MANRSIKILTLTAFFAATVTSSHAAMKAAESGIATLPSASFFMPLGTALPVSAFTDLPAIMADREYRAPSSISAKAMVSAIVSGQVGVEVIGPALSATETSSERFLEMHPLKKLDTLIAGIEIAGHHIKDAAYASIERTDPLWNIPLTATDEEIELTRRDLLAVMRMSRYYFQGPSGQNLASTAKDLHNRLTAESRHVRDPKTN